jgi:peptidoglycan/LPS O-acetylase OafA/YrhL
LKYRPEIDGLRAVAVLPVILFHAGFTIFRGGFVGVDVFFVISGYLITSILINDIELGKFSIARFYERRARRILPALFVVILACIPFAWMWMMPDQWNDFSASITSLMLAISNIYFLSKTGYFEAASNLKPLLHTWSLSVEEQYYFLFPIVLFLIRKLNVNIKLSIIILITILSFVFSQWGAGENFERNYFFSLSRFWEISLGSALALVRTSNNQNCNNWISAVGLALIVYSVFTFDDETPFPFAYAFVPVLGTALVILYSRSGTWSARILSSKPFVSIGVISYSTYLWHQPLFAFARVRLGSEPSKVSMLILSILSMLLAWITWKWVETPFRKGTNTLIAKQRNVFAASISSAILLAALGYAGYAHQDFYSKVYFSRIKYAHLDEGSAKHLPEVFSQWEMSGYTSPNRLKKDQELGLNVFPGNVNRAALLLGDSHSEQYWNAFDEIYGTNYPTRSLPNLYVLAEQTFPPDITILDGELGENIDTLILSYFWSYRYHSPEVNESIRCCGNGENGVVGKSHIPSSLEQMNQIDRNLEKIIRTASIKDINVVLVLDNPFGEEFNAQSLLKVYGNGLIVQQMPLNGVPRSTMIDRVKPIRDRLISIAKRYGARVIDPINYICNQTVCPVLDENGHMLYKDYDHISEYAARNSTRMAFDMLQDDR